MITNNLYNYSKLLKSTPVLFFGLLIMLLLSFNLSATTKTQVENQIHHYIKTQIVAEPNKKVEIIVNSIDKRRKLAQCLTPLKIELAGKHGLKRNNTVRVNCQDQWKLFVAVRIKTLMSVVTATNNLSPGTRLSSENLQMSYFDVSTLRGEMSLDIDKISGSKVKRYVQQGRPLLSNLICLVCKGDPVTLRVKNSRLNISSPGTALTDGSMGQVIAAKNNSSGRRVEGIVVAVGEIEIN